LTRVDYVEHTGMLATTDSTLADDIPATQPGAANQPQS
jgi:hypothetical protein